jgi:hypothetical protein
MGRGAERGPCPAADALAKGTKSGYGLSRDGQAHASAATGAPPGEIVSEREMATKDEERAARLKAALRDNLRRRKAQARSRADDAPEPAKAPPAEPAEKS